MKIIAGDWHFWPGDFNDYDIFKNISSLSFNGIEIGIRTDSDLSDERIKKLLSYSNEFNLSVEVLSCFFPPVLWKDRIAAGVTKNNIRKAKDLVLKAFAAAEILGADSIAVWLGADRIRREDDYNLIWNRTIDFLLDILDKTRSSKKNLILEYKPGEVINNTDSFLRLADSLNNARFGLLLDTGHALMQGEDPAVCVNKAIKYLKHIHLDDNNGDYDADIVPGYYHNFKPFFERLKALDYSGTVGMDMYFSIDEDSLDPVSVLKAGRDYLLSLQ